MVRLRAALGPGHGQRLGQAGRRAPAKLGASLGQTGAMTGAELRNVSLAS